MNFDVQVPKDFEPEFVMDTAARRTVVRTIVVLAIIAAIALAGYYFVTRPEIVLDGHGTGTIEAGKVTLDGTYRLTFYAPAAARIWLWPEAGTCESTNGTQEGEMLISATRCIARLTIITTDPTDYRVEIDRTN